MIDYDYPDLFLGDAVTKDFIITDGEVEVISDDSWAVTADATVAIRNVDLESESFELHQSLNSEMQLRFGSCESAYISFVCHSAWWGDIANLKGKVLNVYIIPNNHATKIIQIGVFKVQENKLTNDRKARKVTAYDAMYDILNSDVADWYNNVAFMPIPIAPEPSVAMSSFRNFFLAYFGLEAEETTLVNDSIVLHKTINPETLSGADVIKAICEINGVFGMITNEGKFRFVELVEDIREAAQGVTDLAVSNYIDVEYEDYDSKAITGVYIITNSGSRYRSGSSVTPRNTYTINGNFLIADYKGQDLYALAGRLVTKMVNRYYQPLTVNALGNPVHEVGDAIKVILKDGTELPTYILERNLRGIQALRDTYTARGEEEASESLNSISSRYTQLENNAIQAATEAATVASTTDFVEVIRNIGFRLLDEPTDGVVEYDEENQQVELNWEDPDDIATLEPVPCTWAGTVVVRKEGSAPKHRWDGTLITDSTVRDQYASTALVDSSVEVNKNYYYGIFPYHVWLDDASNPIKHYRYTKVIGVSTGDGGAITTVTVFANGSFNEDIMVSGFNIDNYKISLYPAQDGRLSPISDLSAWYLTAYTLVIGMYNGKKMTKDQSDIVRSGNVNDDFAGARTYLPIRRISNIKKISFDIKLGQKKQSSPYNTGKIWSGYVSNGEFIETKLADIGEPSTSSFQTIEIDADVPVCDYIGIEWNDGIPYINNLEIVYEQ